MTEYVERRSAHEVLACTWSRTLSAGAPAIHVVPDACADVMWHRESGLLYVAGPDTYAHPTSIPSGVLVGARFRPGRAPAGLGVPASAVRDERVDLSRLWPGWRVRRLSEELAAAPSVLAAEQVLASAVAAIGAEWDPAAPRLLELVARGERVAAVADALGWSERQLHRRSLAAFGYGPKVLQRVVRFDRAVRAARRGTGLASVAHTVGYADQAHLAREVRALAGVPMTALL
ncbi:helix-turn-helix transcriptional regulator [Actinophytocola oryzae]|uniref:AraC family transcriptional regulator n=1 Tax=Actinophytocola oryzae TaxID=502181 RepID=A0A4R7VHT5_9PSEU|nr:helix-turn-helix domain-containing protein [Actinophytocola oryzae]TDV48923.1 AraC family transcriptional regulator [Actinophytocola oryzae]